MKKTILTRFFALGIALFVLSMVFSLAGGVMGCGGGGGAGPINPITESENAAIEAYALLKEGRIPEAMAKYDESLTLNPANTTASFGAAFTRMFMLAESDPSNRFLSRLGEDSLQVEGLVGSESYLAALNTFNQTTVALDPLEGPFYGTAESSASSYSTIDWEQYDAISRQIRELWDQYDELEASGGTEAELQAIGNQIYDLYDQQDALYDADQRITCNRDILSLELWNANETTRINVDIYLSSTAVRNGAVLEQSTAFEAGDTIDIERENDGEYWVGTYCPAGYVDILADTPANFYSSWSDGSQGSVVLSRLGTAEGEAVELDFSNVTLASWNDKTITLDGSIEDSIGTPPDKSSYFPFTSSFEGSVKKIARVLSRADDSFDSAGAQEILSGYVPLFQEIADLLSGADVDDSFQFIIPKELYFGTADVPVNRVDLKTLRAGFHFSLMSFYFANSWEFPVNLGTLFDENGQMLVSDEELLDNLNRFFGLKSDHELDEAQTELAEGLALLLDARDAMSVVDVDGVFENDPITDAGYEELEQLVSAIQESLAGARTLPYLEPTVVADLGRLFTSPPDASEIDFDPFVIESGEIVPVEAFFKELLRGTVDLNLAQNYRTAFMVVNGAFTRQVFNEFTNFVIAGEVLFQPDPDTSPTDD